MKRTIVVNGKVKLWNQMWISYEDVRDLAALSGDVTVQYSRGLKQNPQGTLVQGQNVRVKSGMVFNIAWTGNA